MDALFLSLWTWVNNPAHLLEIGVAGVTAAQLANYLPASFPYRTKIVNALHGIFPSPQVFVNGATEDLSQLAKLAPVVEDILAIVENQPPVDNVKTTPAPPPSTSTTK